MSAASNGGTNGGGKDPWAWLGLLKWSLQYSDGTRDEPVSAMSDEDRAFLEKVMKEGIIDENERMRFILDEATRAMEHYKRASGDEVPKDGEEKSPDQMDGSDNTKPPPTTEELVDLLQELKDIVEQIDFARAFCSLQGLPFLLGCASAKDAVPEQVRETCLGILSTLSQNNPPVQEQLLNMGALKTLSDIYFDEQSSSKPIAARSMQAIGSIVRSHEMSEGVFEKLPQAPELLLSGLRASDNPQLQAKSMFMLRAFLTSDTTTPERIQDFAGCVEYVIDKFILRLNNDPGLTMDHMYEQSLTFLLQLLKTGKATSVVTSRQKQLVSLGVEQMSELGRQVKGKDPGSAGGTIYKYDSPEAQLELWDELMLAISNH